MRHRKAGLKLSRTASHRNAMFRNMVTSLFKYERIRTTDAKAKELRRWADHLITLAKRGDLHARRQALAIIQEKDVVHKLFENAAERFGAINGGYTRIVKLGFRAGDAAALSVIELVAVEPKRKPKKKKKAKDAAGKKKAPKAAKVDKKAEEAQAEERSEAEAPAAEAQAPKAKARGRSKEQAAATVSKGGAVGEDTPAPKKKKAEKAPE